MVHSRLPITIALTAALVAMAGCATVSDEQQAATAAREASAAEAQRQAVVAHNAAMRTLVDAYEIGATTWRDVQRDFGPTWRETRISPVAGKLGMLSTMRTATRRFDDPSKSTSLVGRVVIGSWTGSRRATQAFVSFDRDPQLFDVLVTLDFVDNILVRKY